ncbi:SdiA-regulated domain-containing protein [uncultured Cyclobacterium sp.]|uniref:SdiA-regulated domain-containing protein n=1 Tax=uncultured Cyclobacterium sp. TaxID=453820 RepID=UPI0030EBF69D|tara:strand:+ start:24626 stop:25483 length:858 start_codon:yes stop_codon:yes gene_type:complete
MMYFSQILTLFILANWQCTPSTQQQKEEPFPTPYSLNDFQKIVLQDKLEEISGLEWVGKEMLLAIEDESSVIYSLDTESGKVLMEQKFANKHHDIEDIAYINDAAWVLQSDGTLYEVTSVFNERSKSIKYEFPIDKKRDMEAMVISQDGSFLYVFCKSCKWDDTDNEASVFRFNLSSKAYDEVVFTSLKRREMEALLQGKEMEDLEIEPAAAAFHPIEKQLYVLSSSGKWLMIADANFQPKEVYRLNRNIFKKPEGITFDPKGNMYISNEARGGRPNILVFNYKP